MNITSLNIPGLITGGAKHASGAEEDGPTLGLGSLVLYAGAATGAYALYEQLRFRMYRKRRDGKSVPGPSRVTPFLGGLVEMVMDPYAFWEKQRRYSPLGFSYNSLFGKHILFVTDADKCRELMSVNDPSKMLMVLHPSAKNILGHDNMAFIHGPEHKLLRKSFLSLFTRKALSTYVELQDGIIRSHIARWLAEAGGTEREVRESIRDLNQATSQQVFVGPYLDDPAVEAKFSDGYRAMTDAFLAFPVCLPGTTVWKGRSGRKYVMTVLGTAARRACEYAAGGGEPRCLMDFWAARCLEEVAEAEAEGVPPPGHTSHYKMADAMLLFLFASQDASTASLVWVLATMADRPEVLAKVREEQYALRGADPGATIDGEALGAMTYTRQVVRELLRWRAPAPMVPQMAYTDYPLTEEYSVPRGTLVFPSINSANMQGFPDAETFDPERFGPERQEDLKHAKNYLTFGWGPHYCVGKEYAINQLVCFLAIMSTSCDWTRRRTERSDEWQYLPTIYPYDSLLTLTQRTKAGP